MTAAFDPATAAPGAELPAVAKGPVTRDMLKAYAAASGDPNPMHTDDEFARAAGHPGVFAHGMLSMGWLGELLVRAGGVGSIRRFRARFAKLTWPGETITCRGRVTAVRGEGAERVLDCEIWTENQDGERKLVGTAVLAVPGS
jgi:acyl dehydratase